MTLAEYLLELGPLLKQLEAAVASGGDVPSAGPGQLFEWRIRARILEDKLYQVSKPPGREKTEEELALQTSPPPPVFSDAVVSKARMALAQVNGLREALQNKKLKVALSVARMVAATIAQTGAGASHNA